MKCCCRQNFQYRCYWHCRDRTCYLLRPSAMYLVPYRTGNHGVDRPVACFETRGQPSLVAGCATFSYRPATNRSHRPICTHCVRLFHEIDVFTAWLNRNTVYRPTSCECIQMSRAIFPIQYLGCVTKAVKQQQQLTPFARHNVVKPFDRMKNKTK